MEVKKWYVIGRIIFVKRSSLGRDMGHLCGLTVAC